MVKFHSRVVRVSQMGGKTIVNFKEKIVDEETPNNPQEMDEVKMFDKIEDADDAIAIFMTTGQQ